MSPEVTSEILRKHMATIGRIGGSRGSRADKARAGHAGMSTRLKNLADAARKAGQLKEADLLTKQAEKHAKLAKDKKFMRG
jgi:hypothetical protein